MSTVKQTPLPTPLKGKADWREYKAFRLENGVTCLAINDKESKTTAMSCIVEVGASSDPRELSGLAHFCEHMCFLGSEKYPGENQYKRYLSSHGGRSNASTSMHLTNFKFEVLADHAEKAVDIFSNFFVSPLFTSSGTSREVQAVSSENSKNLTADGRRRLQILKDLADQDHYYSKFSTGNSETLPSDSPEKLEWLREALLAFHRRHYRPEKMTVVIAGPQPMETLEKWVGERYSKIKTASSSSNGEIEESIAALRLNVEKLVAIAAKDAPPYAFEEAAPPYNSAFRSSLLKSNEDGDSTWPILLTTKPLRSMRKLNMMFPIPSDRKTPDRAPSSMLSHLLGHEGVGSAFAALQNSGLLSSLSSGARTRAPDFTLFQIDMGLTEKGEENWEEVANTIFAYCRMLQKKANGKNNDGNDDPEAVNELRRIWEENGELHRIFFDQTSPSGAYSYAPDICDSVVSYGTEACLSAGRMLHETKASFPLKDFTEYTELLVPENCIVERCSEEAYKEMEMKDKGLFPDGFGLKKERWYGVEYYLAQIEKNRVLEWKGLDGLSAMNNGTNVVCQSSGLHLPLPNRYIPRTLELCPDLPEEARRGQRIDKPIDPPSLLVNEENWKLFHRLDDRYALPKSSLQLLIRNLSLQNTKNEKGEWIHNPKSVLLSSFLAAIFNESMAQETYDASLAGLRWSLSIGSTGIKLNCFGFSDRLPDLALRVLSDFLSGEFLRDEKFFVASRDRVIRSLGTYFESRRADAHAMYYRDSLLSSKDEGVAEKLEIAIAAEFEDVVKHHQTVLQDTERSVQCLFNGNVSRGEAMEFFSSAKAKIKEAYEARAQEPLDDEAQTLIDPGMVERQLQQGQDIELHFSSQNVEEENGAVLCSYQSSIPSFKGETLSHPLALRSSSTIRLICHMMREPLFDSLRTKQQLGYIVSSYYEIGMTSQSNENGRVPLTTPVDFISINVLSQKMAPPDIADRIDEFIEDFRRSLEAMPESEIRDHADALATKLLKPTQKLLQEAGSQYSRIQHYGPEVFHRRKQQSVAPGAPATVGGHEIPWDTTKALASTIRGLGREDLLETFDRMTHPSRRSRVVSCVYGKKFPLATGGASAGPGRRPSPIASVVGAMVPLWRPRPRTTPNPAIVVGSLQELLSLRRRLPGFDLAGRGPPVRARGRTMAAVGLGVALLGVAAAARRERPPTAPGRKEAS
ncbi:unnamed protein product [Pseudo-nitzschia multistriata]|uniref:Peptidase M16 N-terminal domain-containing protein n=1 Tax=Pseudo-nitzschia multistriata TaxID=183589 RepID=A0A448ZMW9_9STRA|nr:unnamed protein product [Pseudo-nitzschia multistriata]